MKILFICKGNIGRSQFAEGLFKKHITGDHDVFSAGTTLSGPEEPLSQIPFIENVIETMREEGIDVSNNYRNQLSESIVNNADIVILMADSTDPIPQYLQNNKKVTIWNVDNPKGMDLEGHKRVKDEIKALITEKFID